MSKNNIIRVTDVNFAAEVLGFDGIFLLDFWADWCGPCLAIAPHIESLADEYMGKIKIGKLNIDLDSEVAARFEIRAIPTLILFKNGKIVDRVSGNMSKIVIENLIKKYI